MILVVTPSTLYWTAEAQDPTHNFAPHRTLHSLWLYSAGTEYMEAGLFQSQLRYGAVVSRRQVNNFQWTKSIDYGLLTIE